jgi:transposase
VPKPSHLRSVNPKTAPAAHGAAAGSSGAALEAEPTPLGSPASAAPGAAARVSSVSVEIVPKPGRRRFFSASEKQRILGEAAACLKRGERGGVEALLRREGIYSSHLTAWRKQLALRGREGLVAHKPGPKPKFDAKDRRIAELEKRAARLEAKLSLAEKLIDLQKKVSAILGIDLARDGES